MPFLRPPDAPSAWAVYRVCIPDDEEYRTQLWGAISILTDTWRWEGASSLSDDELREIWTAVLNSFERSALMEAGLIMHFAGGTIPDGWLVCDGSSVAQADYPELYAVIGTTYGGTGSNFNLPNLEDRFTVGAGNSYANGDTGGQSTVTLSTSQIPSHDHSVHSHLGGLAVSPGELPVTLPNILSGSTGSTGGGGSHENKPPYIGLTPIISTGKPCTGV